MYCNLCSGKMFFLALHCIKNYCLSGPLNRLNAILSLLHPPRPLQEPLCDRDCDWKALCRPISHIHTQVGVVNRLVLNHLGSSTARFWCCLCLPLNQQKGRQTTQAHLPYGSIALSATSDVETVTLEKQFGLWQLLIICLLMALSLSKADAKDVKNTVWKTPLGIATRQSELFIFRFAVLGHYVSVGALLTTQTSHKESK